jgi:hypothetical protein
MFYVFEYYLSLYTTIFKNFISYYFFENFIKQNLKQLNENELIEDISSCIENRVNNNLQNEREKEFHVIENDFYEEHSANRNKGDGNNRVFTKSKVMTVLTKIPYLKGLNAFSTVENKEGLYYSFASNKNKEDQGENFKKFKNIPFAHSIQVVNFGNSSIDKKYDKILHINDSEYIPKYSAIFSRS